MKNIIKPIGIIGSICSIIGLAIYFYPEAKSKNQRNKAIITNADSTQIEQSNSGLINSQSNEVVADSISQLKIQQEND